MSEINEENQAGQSAIPTLLKLWTDSVSKIAQATFSFAPQAAPPELLRQVRSGMFQGLTQSWDEYLRSPGFAQSIKEMMDNAIACRKAGTEVVSKMRRDLGGVGQEDFDAAMRSLHHFESRVLERLDELSGQLAAMNARLDSLGGSGGHSGARRKPAVGVGSRRRARVKK